MNAKDTKEVLLDFVKYIDEKVQKSFESTSMTLLKWLKSTRIRNKQLGQNRNLLKVISIHLEIFIFKLSLCFKLKTDSNQKSAKGSPFFGSHMGQLFGGFPELAQIISNFLVFSTSLFSRAYSNSILK